MRCESAGPFLLQRCGNQEMSESAFIVVFLYSRDRMTRVGAFLQYFVVKEPSLFLFLKLKLQAATCLLDRTLLLLHPSALKETCLSVLASTSWHLYFYSL